MRSSPSPDTMIASAIGSPTVVRAEPRAGPGWSYGAAGVRPARVELALVRT